MRKKVVKVDVPETDGLPDYETMFTVHGRLFESGYMHPIQCGESLFVFSSKPVLTAGEDPLAYEFLLVSMDYEIIEVSEPFEKI